MKKKVIAALICAGLLFGCSTYHSSYRYYSVRAEDVPPSVTVKSGDTVYDIARYYNVPMQEIIQLNHLSAPYLLQVGQDLKMPAPKVYRVQSGDTLYKISRSFDMDMTELAQMNKLKSPYTIVTGQQLYLPYTSGTGVVASGTASKTWQKPRQVATYSSKQTASQPVVQAAPRKPVQSQSLNKLKTASTPTSSGQLIWPVKGTIISEFGPKTGGEHNDGINIQAAAGTSVAAVDNGLIAYVGDELRGYGNLVLIRHDNGLITAYAHLDKITVAKGQRVGQGDIVGTVGQSGGVSPAQLHFELRQGSKAINPKTYLRS